MSPRRLCAPARPRTLVAALVLASAAAGCADAPLTAPQGPAAPSVASVAKLEIELSAGAASGESGSVDSLVLVPGDTVRLSAILREEDGAIYTPSGLTWTALDTTVAEVDAEGLVRARDAGSTAVIVAEAHYADTIAVVVSGCGSATVVDLAVGGVRAFAAEEGSDVCLEGGITGAEYVLIPFSAAPSADEVTEFDVTASGVTNFSTVSALRRSAVRAPTATSRGPARDAAFHQRLARVTRPVLRGRMAAARQAYRARRGGGGVSSPPSASFARARVGASVKVGDRVALNAALETCAVVPGEMRTGRVAAVTARAVVVADTLNPAGGFTDAEYRSFAAAFDTLVRPVAVEHFGEPSDVDGNGRVVIFFTSAVNALTPADAGYYVGGFFFGRDLFPNDRPEREGGCAGSNSAEMFYLLAPDPEGRVNGNRRSKAFVAATTVATIGHEFEHLINASRRLYVNDAAEWETTWLDEGLAHLAEELLYFRAAGVAPRSALGAAALGGSAEGAGAAFADYAAGNFGRLSAFLESPETASPFGEDDGLATRGATWSFLRYAADRLGALGALGGDAGLLWRLANSASSGRANLADALGATHAEALGDGPGGDAESPDVDEWARDWAVATFAGGAVEGVDARYTLPSWDQRALFAALGGVYPLATRPLADGFAERVALAGGAAAYLPFAVPAGGRATVRARDGESALSPFVRLAVMRTK